MEGRLGCSLLDGIISLVAWDAVLAVLIAGPCLVGMISWGLVGIIGWSLSCLFTKVDWPACRLQGRIISVGLGVWVAVLVILFFDSWLDGAISWYWVEILWKLVSRLLTTVARLACFFLGEIISMSAWVSILAVVLIVDSSFSRMILLGWVHLIRMLSSCLLTAVARLVCAYLGGIIPQGVLVAVLAVFSVGICLVG